jgi:hypothetical protein
VSFFYTEGNRGGRKGSGGLPALLAVNAADSTGDAPARLSLDSAAMLARASEGRRAASPASPAVSLSEAYIQAERAAALEYLRGRRILRASWKDQGHLREDQHLVEIEGLLGLCRVMRILTHVFLPAEATDRRVQNKAPLGLRFTTA